MAEPRHALAAPFQPRDGGGPIAAAVVAQAAVWAATLQSGVATDADRAACLRWRRAHPEHERAWRRMSGLGEDLRLGAAGLPPPVARGILDAACAPRRRAMKAALGLAGLGVAAGLGWRELPLPRLLADYRTGAGQRETVVLEDGTRVMLGTASAIDVRFDATQRLVTLREGRILVVTGEDARHRPFIVATGSGSIRPVGTRYTVRYEPRVSPVVHVAVQQGAVDIQTRDGARTLRLRAGEQTAFDARAIDAPQGLDHAATAWTDGMLLAERMRLADFVAELGRYRAGHLGCEDSVADLLVSGAFPVEQPDAVLAALQEILPLRLRYVTRYWVTLAPR
ncbi:FecR domain-containing protein [Achromobacter aloeverae]